MQLVAYWAPLKLLCCLLYLAMPCLIKSDMHHIWLCIMPWLCDGCLPYCLLLSGLLLSLASVSFRSCEDSFDYVPFVFFMDLFFFLAGSQARWPLPSISLLSLLASCFVLSLCCATYHLLIKPPSLPCQPLTFFTLPSKTIAWLCYRFAQPLL